MSKILIYFITILAVKLKYLSCVPIKETNFDNSDMGVIVNIVDEQNLTLDHETVDNIPIFNFNFRNTSKEIITQEDGVIVENDLQNSFFPMLNNETVQNIIVSSDFLQTDDPLLETSTGVNSSIKYEDVVPRASFEVGCIQGYAKTADSSCQEVLYD